MQFWEEVAYHLSIGNISFLDYLQVIIPNRNARNLLNTSNAFNQSSVITVGLFGIQSEIDEKYIITPLSFLQDLSKGKIRPHMLRLNLIMAKISLKHKVYCQKN